MVGIGHNCCCDCDCDIVSVDKRMDSSSRMIDFIVLNFFVYEVYVAIENAKFQPQINKRVEYNL